MIIKESELINFPCPLMDKEEDVLFKIAHDVLKRGILKSFEGNPLSINKIRDLYVQSWDDHWIKTHGEIAVDPTGPYWIGPRAAIKMAAKINSFLNKYEIIVPIQPYSYTLETYVIEGTNCIVRSKVGKIRPWLSLNIVQENSFKRGPVVGLSLIIKFYNTYLTNTQLTNPGILIFPLNKGKIKTLIIKNINLVKEWIISSAKSRNPSFPIVGQHCNSCKSRKCTEVLNVGQSEDSRVGWLRQISSNR
jgi:hypothetical protein